MDCSPRVQFFSRLVSDNLFYTRATGPPAAVYVAYNTLLIMVIILNESNSVCNHTSDQQNRTTANRESDFLITSMTRDIIIHWTHYLFSDWPRAYSEFWKSVLMTSSSCTINNHIKDTQGHGQYCHVWSPCMISKLNISNSRACLVCRQWRSENQTFIFLFRLM